MCLIAFNWKNHHKHKLILIANRDEFYHRSTQPIHFREEYPSILAGKDMEAGGTWLGINKTGKFTALTNYRDPVNTMQNAPSRGHLTLNYLKNISGPREYMKEVAQTASTYNGYNLLAGDLEDLFYFSNYENDTRKLVKGTYALSNHLLDTPWYKTSRVKQKLTQAIQKENIETSALLDLLYDMEKPEDRFVQQTGMSMNMERMLSSMFIESPNYGTRCSSVVLIDYDNTISFTERIYIPKTRERKEQTFQFTVNKTI